MNIQSIFFKGVNPVASGASVVQITLFYRDMYPMAEFTPRHRLTSKDIGCYIQFDNGQEFIQTKRGKWLELNTHNVAVRSSSLTQLAEQALERGDEIINHHGRFIGTMARRKETIWNGTDDAFAKLNDDHPIMPYPHYMHYSHL